MKYIYLIQSLEDGYYKIGISKNPNKRIKQLQTGNSSPLKLINYYKTDFAEKIEGNLHRKYKNLHKEGEWFDLSIEQEVSFIDECKKIEENIKFLIENNNPFI
jgi:hypothetical protein